MDLPLILTMTAVQELVEVHGECIDITSDLLVSLIIPRDSSIHAAAVTQSTHVSILLATRLHGKRDQLCAMLSVSGHCF